MMRTALLLLIALAQLATEAVGGGGRPTPCQMKGGCPDDVHALCQPAEAKPQWPTFHLMDNVTRLRGGGLYVEGLNDINAVFSHRGLYHIMNQAGGGDWTNAVSADLVHWYHLNHALDPSTRGPLAREKWGGPCDGTLSFPNLGRDPYNGSTPVILYGPNCRCTRGRGCNINGTAAQPAAQGLGAVQPMDAARIEVALPADPDDVYLSKWVKNQTGSVRWEGSTPCSFPGRVWKSRKGNYWNQVCAFNGSSPWARFVSTDPTLMHWKLAASPFVVGIPANATTCYGSSMFHRIPGAEAGGPTHMISANSGAAMFVGTYDSSTELMTVVGGRQTLDSSSNYQWAAAGTNGPDPETDTGRLLTVAWVRAGGSGRVPCMSTANCPSVVSLVRSVRWDPITAQLVSYPVEEYSLLHNETFIEGKSLGGISAGTSKPVPVARGTGSADILVSFELVAGASSFGVSVRSGDVKVEVASVTTAPTGGGFAVLLGFYSGPQPCKSVRGQPPCSDPPSPPPPTNATIKVAVGETLDIRVLVDRPIVEIFINRGRAAFVSADTNFSVNLTDVSVFNGGAKPVTASNVSAYRMGCGWATVKPKPASIKTDDEGKGDTVSLTHQNDGVASGGAVSRAGLHVGRWDKPPARCPSSMVTDGPLLGNGDAGAAAGGFLMSSDGKQLQQSYYVGKMDFWTQQNRNGAYFSHVAPGHVGLKFGAPPPPPPQPTPPPCPKALAGFCELPHHIPCSSDCESKPGGCAASCGVMGSWPLPTKDPHLLNQAVAKICNTRPSCVAFGLYSKFYELYNKSSSALAPVINSQWTLFYRNASCTLPGAQSACLVPPPPAPTFVPLDQFSASQELLQARVNASIGSSKGAECGTVTSSAVMAPNHNVILARITTTKDCALELSLNSPNMYGLPITVGSSAGGAALTMARQNNKWQHNDATLTECAALVVNSAVLRKFVLPSASASLGALVNGSSKDSCMGLKDDSSETQPHQKRGSFISMARCGTKGTGWTFDASTGHVASSDVPGQCVGYYVGALFPRPSLRQIVAPVDCNGANGTDWATKFKLVNQANGATMMQAVLAGNASRLDPMAIDPTPPCLSIVRDNINISLAMAVSLSASGGTPVVPTEAPAASNPPLSPSCGPLMPSNGCKDVHSVTASYSLKAGQEYLLRIAIETTRGSELTPTHSSAMAKALRLASAETTAVAVESENARVWADWFNASEVDLGEKRQYLEGFWYGSQYMLRCFAKGRDEGGVIPGLLGPWSLQDPVGWSDDVTLDYNVEANFYGAASSNHADTMWSYFPTLTALMPLGRERASLQNWVQGGHESGGTFGQMTEAMGCCCDDYNHCYREIGTHAQCPANFGGFDGIEIPSAIGGFVEMHCSHDSSMRSTAAMAAQPFIDYVDYTGNQTFMKETAFPYVREVASFYASYLKIDSADGLYGVPFGCAQELCNGRQAGESHPQKDDTIDLAYSRWIFAKAIEWGGKLGEPAAVLDKWEAIAGSLKSYPLTDQNHPGVRHGPAARQEWCAASNCSGFSEAINTDENRSAIMWANQDWPISNFAPIHPTGQVGISSDNHTKTLARNTIWLVNNRTRWHGVNGICLSWPSASRMMDKTDPYPFGAAVLLDTLEQSLRETMQPNFWPSMGGGGLEQVGATHAVNELLLQSFESVGKAAGITGGTFLRFFPGWPIGERASFKSLRAIGGFLVDGSVDTQAAVSGVSVLSTVGGNCTFLPFEGGEPSVKGSKGDKVAIERVGDGLRRFLTSAGERYAIS
jgi:hypothetical protein